jgi:hypothetical protein
MRPAFLCAGDARSIARKCLAARALLGARLADSGLRMIVSRGTRSCVPREGKTSFIESSFNFTTRRSPRRKREGSINRKLHRGGKSFRRVVDERRSPPVKHPTLASWFARRSFRALVRAEYSITYAAALRRLRCSYVKQSVRQ